MKLAAGQIRLAATDLGNHLACRHLTTLDLEVARGKRTEPAWAAPDLAVIRERGERHEREFLAHLSSEGLTVENLGHIPHAEEKRLLRETLVLMEAGADVIAQGALADGAWFGRPDVLRRVTAPSKRWAWSYEVADTKLAKETKATTILQLSLYSELLGKIQGTMPEFLWVIPPGEGFAGERYRVSEYAAYYRYVKERLIGAVAPGSGEHGDRARSGVGASQKAIRPKAGQYLLEFAWEMDTLEASYPEPVEHCHVCKWFRECDARRRADDHLSLVADLRRQQQDQFVAWNVGTMAKLAALPIPLEQKPRHGAKEAYVRMREQARVQVEGRTKNQLVEELLLPVAEGMGFCRLPEPSKGDVFMDFEGDPFVGDQGLQYLFGFAAPDARGELVYEKRWALNRDEEKKGFEWLVDEIMRRRGDDPKMHVYHFGAYEPGTMKRLMGMHATREDEIDRMLRAGMLVDLHQAFKQGVRASVEEYSLKKIEAFYGFNRETPLDKSRSAMRYVEHRLELGWGDEALPEEIRDVMEGYNREDCVSTAKLREWLEVRRKRLVRSGTEVPRHVDREEAPSEELDERQRRVAALVERLTDGIPADFRARTNEQQARWLLAQLEDWHRREDKAAYWEGYRLADLDDADLLEDRAGLAGLKFLRRLQLERKIPVDRYSFERQETEARAEKELYSKGEKFGTVVEIDPAERTVDIKKTKKTEEMHPTAVYVWDRPLNVKEHAEALFRIGEWVAANGIEAEGKYRAGRDLLLRKRPRLAKGETLEPRAGENPKATACRIASALRDSLFAIQGPPGAGKTFTGARMICELVKQGKKIGVTALSHKVIRKLLEEVVDAAKEAQQSGVNCLERSDDEEWTEDVAIARKNEEAWAALASGKANVVGGTSWMWSPEAAFEAVDVLFIDEAGQMGLADVLAVSQAAKSLVLIGDPQQLERPLKGSHPDGAEKSALEHLLGERKTIPEDMGFLLPKTWRLHPKICDFTSELFYEGRLQSELLTHSRVLEGHPWLEGAGLWFVPVEHEGNRNSCAEEVELVARIVKGLLRPEVKWFCSAGNERRLTEEDILIVAPYNAQVADLWTRLPNMKIGTVDKFQGQEEAVVIYSMTTSSPQDAPRGMEFLYSLNRLNVATSRAKTAVVVVGSPRLFEPECRSPRQMQLANALCR
ncbi:MAG TPA: TM0106 family RecB-like putative nuclease, partial [Candidatus Acidoferrum sp.]